MSKEKTIPFTVEKYKELSHKDPNISVVTKGGVKVRILCTNAKGSNREDDVIALVGSELGSENVMRYYSNGKLISDSANKGHKDLMISLGPVPKLKPFATFMYKGQSYIIDSVSNSMYHVTAIPPYSDHICSAVGICQENELIVLSNSPLDDWEAAVYNVMEIGPSYANKNVDERVALVKETAKNLLEAAKEKILGDYPSKAIYDKGFEAGMSVHNEKPVSTYKDQIEDYLKTDKGKDTLLKIVNELSKVERPEVLGAMSALNSYFRGKEKGRREVYKELAEMFRNMGFTVKELEECGGK